MAGRVLRKSNDRMVAGVCSGLAEFLGWPTRTTRIAFVLISFAVGAGLILYLILALAMPGPDPNEPGRFNLNDHRKQ